MNKKIKLFTKLVCIVLMVSILFQSFTINTNAEGLIEDLFDFSYYYFHFLDENGKIKETSTYTWGAESEDNVGLSIDKTDLSKIRVDINASNCKEYQECKPVLMWVHKADGIFDTDKFTDIEYWYRKKLEETFLIAEIPDYTSSQEFYINVPMKLNLGMTGLINGGYYEIEFYGDGAIPDELLFAYKIQTFTLEELEKYIKYDMADKISEYYNIDTGFRPEKDGLPFRNSDFDGRNGVCAGIANLTIAKFLKYSILDKWSFDGKRYEKNTDYKWYEYIFGNKSIHDILLNDSNMLNKNSPSKNALTDYTSTAFPNVSFKTTNESDLAFYALLKQYLTENNKQVLTRGNSNIAGIKLNNLQNRWSIIDYVASYMRQGKPVVVNLSSGKGGGHAIVGYKMKQIDNNTVRLYCYDSNYPDNMLLKFKDKNSKNQNYNTNESGAYENIEWIKTEPYVDIKKETIEGYVSNFRKAEFDVFKFDASNTSFQVSSKDGGSISFSVPKQDGSIGVFNYGSESNEVTSYKAFPIIENNKTVKIRTFAFYKSGEVVEITNFKCTNIQMDYNFIGKYKISNSKIQLTDKKYKFVKSGNDFIDCYVAYDNLKNNYGKIKVRIPVKIG